MPQAILVLQAILVPQAILVLQAILVPQAILIRAISFQVIPVSASSYNSGQVCGCVTVWLCG